jgi:hypothetical protein
MIVHTQPIVHRFGQRLNLTSIRYHMRMKFGDECDDCSISNQESEYKYFVDVAGDLIRFCVVSFMRRLFSALRILLTTAHTCSG